MAKATIDLSEYDRQCAKRSAILLRTQADYLEQTDSIKTLPEVRRYLATMEKLSSASDTVEISPADTSALQQTRVLLEGLRNGFANANFDDRAKKIDDDATRLGELVKSANQRLSESN